MGGSMYIGFVLTLPWITPTRTPTHIRGSSLAVRKLKTAGNLGGPDPESYFNSLERSALWSIRRTSNRWCYAESSSTLLRNFKTGYENVNFYSTNPSSSSQPGRYDCIYVKIKLLNQYPYTFYFRALLSPYNNPPLGTPLNTDYVHPICIQYIVTEHYTIRSGVSFSISTREQCRGKKITSNV